MMLETCKFLIQTQVQNKNILEQLLLLLQKSRWFQTGKGNILNTSLFIIVLFDSINKSSSKFSLKTFDIYLTNDKQASLYSP